MVYLYVSVGFLAMLGYQRMNEPIMRLGEHWHEYLRMKHQNVIAALKGVVYREWQ